MTVKIETRCPACGSTRAYNLWKWAKGIFWLTEIEITKDLITGEFTMRKVRRKLFGGGNWGWRDYDANNVSKITVPFIALPQLEKDAKYWQKAQLK